MLVCVVVCDEEETPGDSVGMLDSVLEVVDGAASDSDSGNIMLRSVFDEKVKAPYVGCSVLGR